MLPECIAYQRGDELAGLAWVKVQIVHEAQQLARCGLSELDTFRSLRRLSTGS